MELEKLTENILGCAYKVCNTLGFGFVESVYEDKVVNYLTATVKPVGFFSKSPGKKVRVLQSNK